MSECIEIMEDALKTLAKGGALMPLRGHLWLPENVGEADNGFSPLLV